MRVFDEVAGLLELRPSELGFVSDWFQDMIRRVPTVLAFGPDDIKGLRVVPPGADLHGTVVKGARRSSTPGLVVETEEGPFLFGVHALDEVAEAVAEFAGLAGAVRERPAASPSIVAPWQRVPPDPETVARLLDTMWVLAGPGGDPPSSPGEGEVVQPTEFKLAEYRHPLARFSLPLPVGWLRAEDRNGIALLTAEPDDVKWVRANAVVTIERGAPGTTLAGWLDGALLRLADGLDEFLLIDVEETPAGDRPARRVLAHHTTASQAAVTMEQWLVVEGHLGYTVTASVATLEYEEFAPYSARIGRGLRPDPEFTP